MIGEITNHLWQSTVFVLAVAVVATVFRKNRAEVRYWLWLSASLKFLIPFSLLISLGIRLWDALPSAGIPTDIAAPSVSQTMVELTQPFPETFSYFSPADHTTSWIPTAILSLWAFGFFCVALMRCRSWYRVRAAVSASSPINISATFPVLSSATLLEPGVVGFLRPMLLLPEGILKQLTPPQLEAILAHEQCHVRRRDNLTSAFHMIVEATFWFHPAVWFIGAKLVEERERACDEAVLNLGSEPQVYAEGILNVCKSYLESPLRCVSGVTGSDLKKRIRAILTERVAADLDIPKKLALAAAGILVLAAPIFVGVIGAPSIRAQSTKSDGPQFEVASIKLDKTWSPGKKVGLFFLPGGRVSAVGVTARWLAETAYGLPLLKGYLAGGPNWMDDDRYDIEAQAEPGVFRPGMPDDAVKKAFQLMLRKLLADRFKLLLGTQTQEVPIYILTVAKGGPKLKTAAERDCSDENSLCHHVSGGRGHGLTGRSVNMSELAETLSLFCDRTVQDGTGITGIFDIEITGWVDPFQSASVGVAAGLEDAPDPSVVPDLFTVLRQQLGLKLEPQRRSIETYFVKNIDRPSAN